MICNLESMIRGQNLTLTLTLTLTSVSSCLSPGLFQWTLQVLLVSLVLQCSPLHPPCYYHWYLVWSYTPHSWEEKFLFHFELFYFKFHDWDITRGILYEGHFTQFQPFLSRVYIFSSTFVVVQFNFGALENGLCVREL